MSLGIEDILEVLGDAQEAQVIDLQDYASLVTAFTRAIKLRRLDETRQLAVPPSESKRSASEPLVSYAPPDFQKAKPRKVEGVGIEVVPYPPDEGGGEPPLATFHEKELNPS